MEGQQPQDNPGVLDSAVVRAELVVIQTEAETGIRNAIQGLQEIQGHAMTGNDTALAVILSSMRRLRNCVEVIQDIVQDTAEVMEQAAHLPQPVPPLPPGHHPVARTAAGGQLSVQRKGGP